MLDTTPPPQIGSDLPPNTKNRQNPPPLQCKHMQKPCPPSPGRQHPVGTPKPCTHGTHMHPSHSCRAGTGWGGDSWQRTPPPTASSGVPLQQGDKEHHGEAGAPWGGGCRQAAGKGWGGRRAQPPTLCHRGRGHTSHRHVPFGHLLSLWDGKGPRHLRMLGGLRWEGDSPLNTKSGAGDTPWHS